MYITGNDPQYLEGLLDAVGIKDDMIVGYAKPVPNSKRPGFSEVYRNKHRFETLVENVHPLLNTHYKIFEHGVAINGNKPCFGSVSVLKDGSRGPYVYETYNQIDKRRRNLGSGIFYVLQNNKFQPSPEIQDKIKHHGNTGDSFVVTLFSHNRKEWCITDLACSSYSIANTALYDTLGPSTSNYILELTESPVIVCSKSKIPMIIDMKRNNPTGLANLTTIISMDDLSEEFPPPPRL